MKKIAFIILMNLLNSSLSFSQVAVNSDGSAPDNSAMFDVKSSTKGVLLPRMTLAELSNISNPADGLMVYCTDCGSGSAGSLAIFIAGQWNLLNISCMNPISPSAGTHSTSETQITWNWNTVTGATGYKWNTINDYASAEDMVTATSKTETGLTCSTGYSCYVWAYNSCGYSAPLPLTQTTSDCEAWACGNTMTVNHIAGDVAPVSKTVTYGTVTNIPGEPAKCWITQNLGSDHQAIAVADATEASAGWYWQFNRQQGYKHDGSARTPNTTWISSINENSDWLTANDPCALLLGTGWRLPTSTEWTNVDASDGWTTWSGPWSSALKMHAAGYLEGFYDLLDARGVYGLYWSSTQLDNFYGFYLDFNSGSCIMNYIKKTDGFSVRCLRDDNPTSTIPTVTTASISNITQTTATGGGEVTSDGGATVTARGVCWSTSSNPTNADSHSSDGTGTGVFASSLSDLAPGTLYYVRAYAENSVGTAYGDEVSFTTSSSWACGNTITVNHVAGDVAPVNKTVTYGTVTNIPGEPSKCWITSNLGANHQATSVDDATEESAGWYWQFNRMQGYKHTGSTITPSWTITYSFSESSDWLAASDPCALLLGSGWRLPTSTEWTNVDASGGWNNWNGPWNSALKMHAAGYMGISDGSLYDRGTRVYYWSSTQDGSISGWDLTFGSGNCAMSSSLKAYGFSSRCLRD